MCFDLYSYLRIVLFSARHISILAHKRSQKAKTRKVLEDQQDETRLSSGPASFYLGVIRQIQEATNLLSDEKTPNDNKMIEVILKLTKILEERVQLEETKAASKQHQRSRYSYNLRKMKRKRKIAYYYYLKSKNTGNIYNECYNENDIILPRCLIPKHRPDETKQEYELRLKHAKQKLQQEAELLLSRRNYYEKRFVNIDNDIEKLIETKHGKVSLKTLSLKDQWKMESQNEEIKSKEMWQHTEALMRSQLRTFKRTSNHRKPKQNEEKCKNVSRAPNPSAIADNFKTEQKPGSKCTQSLNNIKQREYEYIKEFEKKINAEENDEHFDNSALEKIGAELDALEIYSKSCVKASFERLAICTYGCNNCTIPARISLR